MKSPLAICWLRRAAAFAVVVLVAGCGGTTAPAPAPDAAADVTARWTKAFDAGDAAALAALYADEARSLPPGATLAGRQDIETYWKADIGEGGATTKLSVADSMMMGDLLHVAGTYDVAAGDAAPLANGEFQQLWRRIDNEWRLEREMWRMNPTLVRNLDVASQLTSAWTEAYNAGDAKALVGLYSEGAVLSTPTQGSFSGPIAIGSFWERDFGGSKPSSTLTLTDAYVSGELAHLEGEYKVTDKGTVTEGRYVQLWMREGNAWRVHREMWLAQ
jgi:ketosteroid isomerase-like protein